MGKGYKGVPCVYCLEREAGTADHVIAREFFPKDERDNLPKVAACAECNNAKSKLEHALTAVMPFGARHDNAASALAMTEPRLAKNRKLHSALAAGRTYLIRSINGGPWQFEMTVPVDHTNIERLCWFIVKGLAHHHWGVKLGTEHYVRASFLNGAGRHYFDTLFAETALSMVKQDFGNGVFVYAGVQSHDCPEMTLWKMSIFGAEVCGDRRSPWDRSSTIYGVSAPRALPATEILMRVLGT